MNTVKKFLCLSAVFLARLQVSAVEIPEQGSPTVRVLDKEQNPLPDAGVHIDGYTYTTVTDMNGIYTFAKLPTGTRQLMVDYIGFESIQTTHSVSNDTRNVKDILMSDTYTALKEIVVCGVFSDQQKAINKQKGNVNITHVASADQIGNRLLNRRLAFIDSASYQNTPSASYDTDFLWETANDRKVCLNNYQVRQYFITHERQSYSLLPDYAVQHIKPKNYDTDYIVNSSASLSRKKVGYIETPYS